MSSYVICRLTCDVDGCSRTHETVGDKAMRYVRAQDARESAGGAGWRSLWVRGKPGGKHLDVCPDHPLGIEELAIGHTVCGTNYAEGARCGLPKDHDGNCSQLSRRP